ncbi:MAG: hypothetical protein V1744_02480, partial [Candidatus Altiarchaeota archaeon]
RIQESIINRIVKAICKADREEMLTVDGLTCGLKLPPGTIRGPERIKDPEIDGNLDKPTNSKIVRN